MVGTEVVFSVTSGAATFTDTNTQTTTKSTIDTTGQCSATISSADAGTNTIHAETDVMIGTKTVHLSTGVSAGSSADASKTYVDAYEDARIVLDPLSASNKVGDTHTVTATVETSEDGTNWIKAMVGTEVVFSVTSGAAIFTDTNTQTTTKSTIDTTGQCSATISSADAGTNTIHAETDVKIGTKTVHLSTGVSAGSSADASKTYVDAYEDARIVLDPLSASNKVGDTHTVTATVETSEDGTNWIKAMVGTEVVFSVTSGAATFTDTNTQTTTKSTIDTTGQCSATISSANAGTNTIHAETDVMIGTKTVHLSTGVSAGSSADASKTYVDAYEDARIVFNPVFRQQ